MKVSKTHFAVLLALPMLMLSAQVQGQKNTAGKVKVISYELLGESASPEGISVDPRTGYLYTGSLQDGSMQLTKNGKSAYFVAPGSDLLLPNVLGSAVDGKNGRIWVCSNDFSKSFNGTPTARISVLNLADGSLLKQFDEKDLSTSEGIFPFVNDVVLDKAGNAYISNSGSNTIFRIGVELEDVKVVSGKFPEPPAGKKYSLNGIAITPDQQYLISDTFVMEERDAPALFRINIRSGEVNLIPYEEKGTTDFSRTGGDGLLMLDKNTLLCMSIASTLLRVELDKELSRATITNISKGTAAQEAMVGAATMALFKRKLYTTNAQGISLFSPDYKVVKPFKIIEIPQSVLGL